MPGAEPTADHTLVILDSIADGLFTVDRSFRITSFNRAAERITGIPRKKALGRTCRTVFRAGICDTGCLLRHSIETGEAVVNREITITSAGGVQVPVSISTAILKDKSGRVIGGVETFRDLTAEKTLRAELSDRRSFQDIVSKNPRMLRLLERVRTVADTDVTVLLEGESGTGKGLFARAVHGFGPRSTRPMVVVDCGALPQSLLESELFGYKAGAFTDAKRDKPGRLALARGGTLFLDEIGDISLALQTRLLRVLQDRVFEPLGAVRPENADMRFIIATNRRLEELVKVGAFREDLYYRINVMRLSLPPLRERKDDVPLLAAHFVRKHAAIHGRPVEAVSAEATAVLMSHDWPGNVRELENAVEYGVVVCGGSCIEPAHLPEELASKSSEPVREPRPAARLADLERDYIRDVLENNGYSRKAAAAELGVHPSTLWRRMKRLGLAFPEKDGRSSAR